MCTPCFHKPIWVKKSVHCSQKLYGIWLTYCLKVSIESSESFIKLIVYWMSLTILPLVFTLTLCNNR